MEKILISACLAGDRVRYDGVKVPVENGLLLDWAQKGILIKVCPEVSGGLKIPRTPAEIVKGTGDDVLKGKAEVRDNKGRNITMAFMEGAKTALRMAMDHDIRIAVLKEKSPSCGVCRVYDGSFTARLTEGQGVTTAMLRQNGIQVFSENELDQVSALYFQGGSKPATQ